MKKPVTVSCIASLGLIGCVGSVAEEEVSGVTSAASQRPSPLTPASQISYNNATSEMGSTTAQAVIDELDARTDALEMAAAPSGGAIVKDKDGNVLGRLLGFTPATANTGSTLTILDAQGTMWPTGGSSDHATAFFTSPDCSGEPFVQVSIPQMPFNNVWDYQTYKVSGPRRHFVACSRRELSALGPCLIDVRVPYYEQSQVCGEVDAAPIAVIQKPAWLFGQEFHIE